VGKVIPGVKVVIDTTVGTHPLQGEIIVYGPNVMVGYHNRPEENAKAIMKDGGFRTGDLGYLDEDGFLYITGRIKELYKLENGKYVMPSPLEEELKLSPFIANVMIYGANKPHNVALVIPDAEAVRTWASKQGVATQDLARDEQVRQLLRSEIETFSKELKGYERVQNFIIALEDFTTDNGMLTPTLKLKRRAVLERYGADLDALY
jgi:long-chain acyl-CoA synthetase